MAATRKVERIKALAAAEASSNIESKVAWSAEATSPFSRRYRHSKGPHAYLHVVEEVGALLEEDHG